MTSESLVIYSMLKVGKIVPPNKQILRDISLGFYYGAKIGVPGLNGAGVHAAAHHGESNQGDEKTKLRDASRSFFKKVVSLP
jgi:hypothetical protein